MSGPEIVELALCSLAVAYIIALAIVVIVVPALYGWFKNDPRRGT